MEGFTAVAYTREEAHTACTRAYAQAQALIANDGAALIQCGEAVEPVGVQQRRFLHGPVLTQISEKVHVGEKRERFVMEIWKEYFRRRFLPDKWVMLKMPGAKRATPQRVRQSTEDLGIRAYAAYIDKVIDHAVVEFGIEFEFILSEREAVRGTKRVVRKQNMELETA